MNSLTFDVFYVLEDNSGIVDVDILHKGQSLIRYHDLSPVIDINILGLECPIPHNPFKYLESVFGKNWRVSRDNIMEENNINILELDEVLLDYRFFYNFYNDVLKASTFN